MKVLKYHGDISGLQLNVDKTKVVWIGSMKYSVTMLCPELDLSWEENSFNLLVVTFSKNLNEITDLNYTQNIKEIILLFKAYSKRILTPIGKIVVIKTLALPKINHLIMSLPNPNGQTITQLQILCYTFLWNSGPDKI